MLRILGLFVGASVLALVAGQGLLKAYAPKVTPAAAAASQGKTAPGPQSVTLAADDAGHFVADVRINGMFIKGLVDTGATSVAIPGDVARSLGITPRPSDYTVRVQTANGETLGARVQLNEVRISTIVVRDVEAVIVPKGLSTTLVGMSVIKQLTSEMRGNMLTLRQ